MKRILSVLVLTAVAALIASSGPSASAAKSQSKPTAVHASAAKQDAAFCPLGCGGSCSMQDTK